MKKHPIIVMMLFTCIMYSQTKKNGTIYSEHPAITVVEAMQQAVIAGDVDKVASYLADDFKSFQGTSTNKDAKGRTKEDFLKGVKWMKENYAYTSISRSNGAYPDALEYKDGESGIWVQTWDDFKAVHNATGVKLDMPIHRLFTMTSDNKIRRMFTYDNDLPYAEVRRGFSPRTNGTLYDQHAYINKVRRMMAAFENMDLEKAYSYFDEKSSFSNLEMPVGESMNLQELKANHQAFYKNFEVVSIDVVGYPDALHYEMGNSVTIQSWWNFRLIRKSDKKKLVMPAMYTHDFNDDGMIARSIGYFSTKVLDSK